MGKNVKYTIISNGPGKAPEVLTDGEMRTHFGKDRKEAHVGLAGENRPVKIVHFALGDTSIADIDPLTQQGISNVIDASFRPTGEIEGMNAITTILQANSRTMLLGALLGGDEDLREWIGSRQSHKFIGIDQVLTTKKYELTWRIERTALEDDVSGLLAMRLGSLGREIEAAKFRRVINLFNAMPSAVGWIDGQFIVDTDHSWSTYGGFATSQSNKETGTLGKVALETAYGKMGGLKGFNGNGWASHWPTALLYNPVDSAAVEEPFFAEKYMAGTATATNIVPSTGHNWLYGRIPRENMIAHGGVTVGDAYLIRKAPIGPVLWVERSDVPDEFYISADPRTSDDVAENDQIAIRYRNRHMEGYGHWKEVYGIV